MQEEYRASTSHQFRNGSMCAELVDQALAACPGLSSNAEYGGWRISFDGTHRQVALRLDGNWLSLSLDCGSANAPGISLVRRYLKRNRCLPGAVRIVTQDDGRQARYALDLPVSQLPWDSADALEQCLVAALEGIVTADKVSSRHTSRNTRASCDMAEIAESFAESGWPLVDREEANACVVLEVPKQYCVAAITLQRGSISLTASLLPGKFAGAAKVCRDAVLALLWLTTGSVRMVRPVLNGHELLLEVSVDPAPVAVARACGALSVALRQCIGEAELLIGDEDLAKTYLSVTGLGDGKGISATRGSRTGAADGEDTVNAKHEEQVT